MIAGSGAAATAELLRRARLSAGLTQSELAVRIGTAQSAISRWERGHDEPRLGTLAAIVSACGFRLVLGLERDDVDRAQIRQQLAMTPEERLASVTNITRTLAGARPVA